MHAADAIFICILSILIYFFEEGEGCILLACFLIHLFLMVPCHLVLSEVLCSPFPFFPCIIATSHSRFFRLPPQTLSSSAGPTFLHCPSAPLSSLPLPRPCRPLCSHFLAPCSLLCSSFSPLIGWVASVPSFPPGCVFGSPFLLLWGFIFLFVDRAWDCKHHKNNCIENRWFLC